MVNVLDVAFEILREIQDAGISPSSLAAPCGTAAGPDRR
jgi:hypothetical protein